MRETFFGPLIEDVEAKIQKQMGERWDRDLFENHLMGYTMRTARHRLVAWHDVRNPEAEPLFIELYDHITDPGETTNIAAKEPDLVARLVKRQARGWKAAMAKK